MGSPGTSVWRVGGKKKSHEVVMAWNSLRGPGQWEGRPGNLVGGSSEIAASLGARGKKKKSYSTDTTASLQKINNSG